jgi:hypothetical protein
MGWRETNAVNQMTMPEGRQLPAPLGAVRHDWTVEDVLDLLGRPFPDLLFAAQTIHRQQFDAAKRQFAQLLSIKTGGCRRTAVTARKVLSSQRASRPQS